MTQKIFFCVIACIIICTVNAQKCTYTLKGTVADFHDGSPIIGATIHIKNTNTYATTDINGLFAIKNLCRENVTISISHVSCDTKNVRVNISKNEVQQFYLEHHVEELNEIQIQSNLKSNTTQATRLQSKEIDEFTNKSIGDVLKKVSGVSSMNTGNTIVKPVINGLHSSRVILMANGVRLQDQEWGIEHAPNIDVNTAESITVIKGSNSLEFAGDAIGGVIVVKPRKAIRKDSLFGKTIFGGQSNGRGYNMHSSITKTTRKGWFVTGKASLKKFGDFKSPDYFLNNSGLNSKAFSIRTGINQYEKGANIYYSYINNEIGILKSSHIGNIKDLVDAINSRQPIILKDFSYAINDPKQNITHQILKTDFYKRFQNLGKLEVQYDFQNNRRLEHDIRVGDDRDKPAIDLELSSHTLKANFNFDSNPAKTIKVGMLTSYQNNFANPDTGVKRLIPDYDKYDVGVFTIGNFILNDQTNMNLGVRYDYNYINAKKYYYKSRWSERNYDTDFNDLIIGEYATQWLVNPKMSYHNISASAGVYHAINKVHSIMFNYGLSNRAPNVSELFSDGLHHSAARIELGDLRMEQETSNRFAFTYTLDKGENTFIIESFFNHINNFIYIEPTGTEKTIRGAFPVWAYKKTTAQLFGVDIDWKKKLTSRYAFQNKTSILFGRDMDKSSPLIDIPAPKTSNSIHYKNKKWYQFNASLESEFVFKQHNFPNTNFEAYIPTTNTNVMVDVSTTPNSYHLVHFNSDMTFELSKKTQLNIGISVSNLFNTRYREYLNRQRYFTDDLGRNIGLQIKLNY